MKRIAIGVTLLVGVAITIIATPPWASPGRSGRGSVGDAARMNAPKLKGDDWQSLLLPPAGLAKERPADWKVVEEPKNFQPMNGDVSGGTYEPPTTVDEMAREASLIAVGTLAGHDGSFYALPFKRQQYTTYYLKVMGYLKDTTDRRSPYLKVLAPGGFLDGGQQSEAPVPYLVPDRRYVLYLIPNRGVIWGLNGKSDEIIGKGDEYWVIGQGIGRWWDDNGRLVGPVPARVQYELPEHARVPAHLSFADGIQRVAAAVDRERRQVPYPARRRGDTKFSSPE